MNDYPPLPRAARIEGTVEVKRTLDANGNVTTAEALLREPARRNALQSKFRRTSKSTTFVFELPNKVQIVAPLSFATDVP
jgi:TonB family protein